MDGGDSFPISVLLELCVTHMDGNQRQNKKRATKPRGEVNAASLSSSAECAVTHPQADSYNDDKIGDNHPNVCGVTDGG